MMSAENDDPEEVSGYSHTHFDCPACGEAGGVEGGTLTCQGCGTRFKRFKIGVSSMMPTAGSRLNLLARAELRTGRDLGHHWLWVLHAHRLNHKYEAERRAYRERYPIIAVKGLTPPAG